MSKNNPKASSTLSSTSPANNQGKTRRKLLELAGVALLTMIAAPVMAQSPDRRCTTRHPLVQIRCVANGRNLHLDGLGDRLLSTRSVENDNYTRFFVEPQRDGTIRLRSLATGRYLHVNGRYDRLASTRWQPQDDFTKFIVCPQRDGSVRLKVLATKRYLHVNGLGDNLVSTRWQPNDAFTRFRLVLQ